MCIYDFFNILLSNILTDRWNIYIYIYIYVCVCVCVRVYTHKVDKTVAGRGARCIVHNNANCVLHIRSKVKIDTFVNCVLSITNY